MNLHESAKQNVAAGGITPIKIRIDSFGDFEGTSQEGTCQNVLPARTREVDSAYELVHLVQNRTQEFENIVAHCYSLFPVFGSGHEYQQVSRDTPRPA